MNTNVEELLGSRHGAVWIKYGSRMVKCTKQIIKRISGRHRNLQINNHPGGCINLYFTDINNSKEEIEQLVMEYNNNHINTKCYE